MIAAVDDDGSNEIDFKEFCAVILLQKQKESHDGESDTLDAFIALGGNQDKTGQVSTDKLRNIVKDFGLTIDINRLIAETDTDRSGFIDYQEVCSDGPLSVSPVPSRAAPNCALVALPMTGPLGSGSRCRQFSVMMK